MSFARLPTRTHEHQPERIVCLGIESSGSRTHDRLLRRAKKCSPLSASECLQMPKYQRFPPFSYVRISSKNRLFYPVRVSRVLAASNFGGRPFSHPANLTRQSGGSTEQLPCRPRTLRPFSAFGKADVDRLIRRRPLYPTELRDQVRIYKGFRPFGGPVPDLFSLAGEASC